MLNISLLEDPVIKELLNAGWELGRRTNVTEIISKLEDEGYHSFLYAIEVLEELNGLHIRPQKVKYGKAYPGDAEFDALGAGSGEQDRLEIFEKYTKEALFPLGMAYGQWFLYVGESQKIYIGTMGKITKMYLVGLTIENFLNQLIMVNGDKVELFI